jgi:hypothetical protein
MKKKVKVAQRKGGESLETSHRRTDTYQNILNKKSSI